jgi:mRNA-degrading endonuclease RelE of RelBE toxin-antitoxin system
MVNFIVLIDEDAQEYLENLPKKSNRLAKSKLQVLEIDPFPGKGNDKELLQPKHKGLYRLHISHSYTAFYHIFKEEKIVKILWIGTIEQAHNRYGRFLRDEI